MIFSIIVFILTLLVLVLLHEFGHFFMAKRFGIKVEEFGFGIPPKIWGKKIGETLYSINLLPLGGFVKLLGEDNPSAPRSKADFREKPVGQRIIVVIAGVFMNLILAWALFYIVIIGQHFKIIYPTTQGAGVYVAEVEKGFPAQGAGVEIGEKLNALDNVQITDIEQARSLIRSKPNTPVALSLSDADGGNKRLVSVTPKKLDNGNVLIGVIFSPIPFRQYSTLPQKLFSGITYSWDLTKITFVGLGKTLSDLFSGNFGKVSQSVSGPVGMAGITNDILSSGGVVLFPYFWFVGVISLTLAIFNVLPIPALDGGRLLFLVIEAITRKKVNERIEMIIHQIGFAILLTLAFLVTYSDISKIFYR